MYCVYVSACTVLCHASWSIFLRFLSLDDFLDKTTNTLVKQSWECCLKLLCTELLVRDKHVFCGACQKHCANIISIRRWIEACALANNRGPNLLIMNYGWIIKNKHRIVDIICMKTTVAKWTTCSGKDTLFYSVAKKQTCSFNSKKYIYIFCIFLVGRLIFWSHYS